jgi:hypothetical protein
MMHRKRVMPADSTTRAGAKDNQTFLHARFGLGEDILKPYKETLDRWLWPDVLRKQDTSVVKAKQTISSYRKLSAEPGGIAELMVFYSERAVGFATISVRTGSEDHRPATCQRP